MCCGVALVGERRWCVGQHGCSLINSLLFRNKASELERRRFPPGVPFIHEHCPTFTVDRDSGVHPGIAERFRSKSEWIIQSSPSLGNDREDDLVPQVDQRQEP